MYPKIPKSESNERKLRLFYDFHSCLLFLHPVSAGKPSHTFLECKGWVWHFLIPYASMH